jgi:hypothetical protein
MSLDRFKPLDEVLVADARWGYFGRSLEDHHGLIASIVLNDGVPEDVRQNYENARNAWLYSFFAYRLLSVAFLTLLVACESAIRARVAAEGYQKHASARLVLRNSLAHGETLLKHNLSHEFQAAADFINQLFPLTDAAKETQV